MFISVCGIEGVGKSTQVNRLVSNLTKDGHEVIKTFEPGGTEAANDLRAILKRYPNLDVTTQLKIVEAARLDHLKNVINPALKNGKIVVSDRYIDSTYVYQNKAFNNYEQWDNWYRAQLIPDITFLLYIQDVALTKKRMSVRNDLDHFDNESLDEFNNKQDLFLKASVSFYPSRFFLVDAEKSEDEIAEIIYNRVIYKLA